MCKLWLTLQERGGEHEEVIAILALESRVLDLYVWVSQPVLEKASSFTEFCIILYKD